MTSADVSSSSHPTERLVGSSPAMEALRAQIRHLAPFDTVGSALAPTLLLQGETGTGKGLVARVVHDSGPRAAGPFLDVNCAAIPETMLEAELFGFEPGAFTDAKRAKPGLFEAAAGGTLFLDEIDALPLTLQGKLLTAIEAKRVRRLGAVTERTVDVKLIAATNAALEQRIAVGQFRADLYHRLAVVVVALPPLRTRGEDVQVLAQTLLRQYTGAHGVPPKRLTPDAVAWLHGYGWPGNVRELSHLMERVTLLHVGEEVEATTLAHLGLSVAGPEPSGAAAPVPAPMPQSLLLAEAEQMRQALAQTGGNVVQAARLLGVSRDAMRYRMQRYGIQRSRPAVTAPPGGAAAPPSARLPAAELAPAPLGSQPQEGSLPPDPPRPAVEHIQARSTPEPSAEAPLLAGERRLPAPEASWEQKPVAVLALEMTWPEFPALALQHYEPWTEAARWDQAIREKVQGFGGVLLQHTTSLAVWVFGLAQAVDQLAQRAVHSALAMRQMVAEASVPDMAPCPQVRLAVHLGTVRVQGPPPTAHVLAVGETLALPVRLLGQAAAGEILVSPGVGRLVSGWVALEDRAVQLRAGHRARGGGYAVVGVHPGRAPLASGGGPIRTLFVGRQRELTILEAVLEQVEAGHGHVVGMVGAPGLGKSRLLAEVRQRLRARQVASRLGQCLAYGSATPYLPVLDMLREHCGITASDRPDTLLAKLRLTLSESGLDPEERLPYLSQLLGLPGDAAHLASLSAEMRRARTFETLHQLFLAGARQQPLVLAVEDLHWIDPTSEAWLAALIERLAGVPLVVVTTYRPGYRPPWGDKSYLTQVALQALGPADSRQVVHSVLQDTPLAPALEQQLLARAEGNPFFLEELAQTLREQGERPARLAVPETIQAVLAARIDRLPPEDKRLLQTAAVIGHEVPWPLVQAIAGLPEADLHRGLAHLQAAEFLYETRLFPEHEFTFKHALTHEVAYGGLLQERRRVLHAGIVEAIERLSPDRLAEQVERLAYHALRGEVWDKALRYSRQAGEKALVRSAYSEAVGYFEQALSTLPHVPEQHDTHEQAIDLRFALRTALFPSGDFGRILVVLRQAESLAVALNDPRRLGQVSVFLATHFYITGAYDETIATAQRALALAMASGEVVLHALANYYLGLAYHAQGDYRRAIDCLRQIVTSLEGTRRRERFGQTILPAVLSRAILASCHAELGTFAEGSALGDEGLRIAETVAHPGSLMFASWGVGLLALRQGDLRRALPRLAQAVSICQEADLPLYFPGRAAALGVAYALSGRVADAVLLLTQAMEQTTAMPRVDLQVLCGLSLGEAQMLAGRLEEAYALAEQVLALARAHQERGHQAYALCLLGDIAAQRHPPEVEPAAAHYRQAQAQADELGMRPLQAHCHRGLGTLYAKTGQWEQARAELSTALALYRAMAMTFWLPQVEAVLAQMDGAGAPEQGVM